MSKRRSIIFYHGDKIDAFKLANIIEPCNDVLYADLEEFKDFIKETIPSRAQLDNTSIKAAFFDNLFSLIKSRYGEEWILFCKVKLVRVADFLLSHNEVLVFEDQNIQSCPFDDMGPMCSYMYAQLPSSTYAFGCLKHTDKSYLCSVIDTR